MVTGEAVTQGDHVKVSSKEELEKRLPHIIKRMQDWDYSTPLAVKLDPYENPRSLSQNAMSHIWYREIAKEMADKGHKIDHEEPAEVWKLWLKKRFLGTASYSIGNQQIPEQVKSTSKLTKGEFVHYLDNVYHWATKQGIRLSIPAESEYAELQAQQEA